MYRKKLERETTGIGRKGIRLINQIRASKPNVVCKRCLKAKVSSDPLQDRSLQVIHLTKKLYNGMLGNKLLTSYCNTFPFSD